MSSGAIAVLAIIVVLVAVIIVALVFGRRGYGFSGEIVVRCKDGHLFKTLWIPGVSFKAIRLGMVRYQHCPVGDHWTFVTPVRDADLTHEERLMAERYHDSFIP